MHQFETGKGLKSIGKKKIEGWQHASPREGVSSSSSGLFKPAAREDRSSPFNPLS
jgi:hypothetical protein